MGLIIIIILIIVILSFIICISFFSGKYMENGGLIEKKVSRIALRNTRLNRLTLFPAILILFFALQIILKVFFNLSYSKLLNNWLFFLFFFIALLLSGPFNKKTSRTKACRLIEKKDDHEGILSSYFDCAQKQPESPMYDLLKNRAEDISRHLDEKKILPLPRILYVLLPLMIALVALNFFWPKQGVKKTLEPLLQKQLKEDKKINALSELLVEKKEEINIQELKQLATDINKTAGKIASGEMHPIKASEKLKKHLKDLEAGEKDWQAKAQRLNSCLHTKDAAWNMKEQKFTSAFERFNNLNERLKKGDLWPEQREKISNALMSATKAPAPFGQKGTFKFFKKSAKAMKENQPLTSKEMKQYEQDFKSLQYSTGVMEEIKKKLQAQIKQVDGIKERQKSIDAIIRKEADTLKQICEVEKTKAHFPEVKKTFTKLEKISEEMSSGRMNREKIFKGIEKQMNQINLAQKKKNCNKTKDGLGRAAEKLKSCLQTEEIGKAIEKQDLGAAINKIQKLCRQFNIDQCSAFQRNSTTKALEEASKELARYNEEKLSNVFKECSSCISQNKKLSPKQVSQGKKVACSLQDRLAAGKFLAEAKTKIQGCKERIASRIQEELERVKRGNITDTPKLKKGREKKDNDEIILKSIATPRNRQEPSKTFVSHPPLRIKEYSEDSGSDIKIASSKIKETKVDPNKIIIISSKGQKGGEEADKNKVPELGSGNFSLPQYSVVEISTTNKNIPDDALIKPETPRQYINIFKRIHNGRYRKEK